MMKIYINKESKSSICSSLEQVCSDLILNRSIKINQSEFSIIDIEVYYWHSQHQDDYAYGVDHIKPIGEFENHRYGIDLSLGNDHNRDFGGILICGLFNKDSKQVIEKNKVVKTLFNCFELGQNDLQLIRSKSPWNKVFRSTRLNLGNPNNSNKEEFSKVKYKFLAQDKDIFKKYRGKEVIFRNSDLTDIEILKTLGYRVSR